MLSVLLAAVTLALFGFLLAVTAVRYRTSWALGAALEYPGWLLCGFVVPLAPAARTGCSPLSWAIPHHLGDGGGAFVRRRGEPVARPRHLLADRRGVRRAGGLARRRLVDSARRDATLALT